MHNVAALVATSLVFDASERRVKLKCPRCGSDAGLERALASDAEIRCLACGENSEFRQFREAWCEVRREALTQAFPEIVFPHDRLTRNRH